MQLKHGTEGKNEMCMDDVIKYIKLEDAKKIIRDGVSTDTDEDKDYVCDLLSCLPTIDVLEQKSKWIPVSERLPKRNEVVLVTQITTNNIRCVHLCKYFDDDSENPWWSCTGDGCMWNDEVIAWMPLPEPYRESEE